MRTLNVVLGTACSVLALSGFSQARPDFSGSWIRRDGGLVTQLEISQTPSALTIESVTTSRQRWPQNEQAYAFGPNRTELRFDAPVSVNTHGNGSTLVSWVRWEGAVLVAEERIDVAGPFRRREWSLEGDRLTVTSTFGGEPDGVRIYTRQ